jgi:hypothetical protein
MSACPFCNGELPEPRPDACPHCTATLPPEATGPVALAQSSVPFEQDGDFFTRFVETFKKVIANPVEFFSGMTDGDLGRPILYSVIVQTIATAISIVWHLMFGGMQSALMGIDPSVFAIQTSFMIMLLVFSPLFALIGLFISSGIYHLMLMLLGSGQRGFGITLRAVAYGGTPLVFAVVPLCGSSIGGIWAIVLAILGATYGHRTDGWRATLAYFLPLIVCCCLAFGMLWMFGTLAALTD